MADTIFEAAIAAILKGDADQATEIAKKGLDEGVDPLELMDKGFIPGINQVGDLFETGRLFLPALIYSATAMVVQKELEQELKKAGLREKYKTIVGGAPVTQRWADRIGADAYAQDAGDGVRKVKELLAS